MFGANGWVYSSTLASGGQQVQGGGSEHHQHVARRPTQNELRLLRRHLDGVPARVGRRRLVWSYFPTFTAAQMRNSLTKSALDLGTAGRDTRYGFGLVQAKAARHRIASLGCGN